MRTKRTDLIPALRRLGLGAAFSLLGCNGYVGGPVTDGAPASPSAQQPNGIVGVVAEGSKTAELAPARVRRLSATELRNSIEDVFLGPTKLDAAWSGSAPRHEFDNVFDSQDLSVAFAEQMQTAAEATATSFAASIASALPCSQAAGASEEACASELVEKFGRRAYRRPLTDPEKADLLSLFNSAREHDDLPTALTIVVEAILQSPFFIFRTELGSSPGQAAAPLTPYEVAAALSYAAWRSTPDEALLNAARDGQLSSAAEIQAQFQRLLQGPRAAGALRDFFSQWFETALLRTGISKADPAFTVARAAEMANTFDGLVDRVSWSERGAFSSLLTAKDGILSQPAFLTVQSSPTGFSPIFLGQFVRTKLLCQPLASPPPGVPPPSKDPALSTRERFKLHDESPSCQGCHVLMDPIGFGFERYDELGRYRESETVQGRVIPLTGQGTLSQAGVGGDFTGPEELSQLLAQNAEVSACFTAQLLRFMLGRNTAAPEGRREADEQSLATVAALPAKDMLSVMTNLVTTPSFLYRDTRGVPGAL